jgi:hypothetical protein
MTRRVIALSVKSECTYETKEYEELPELYVLRVKVILTYSIGESYKRK